MNYLLSSRALAYGVSALVLAPAALLAGCGSGASNSGSGANLPPIDASQGGGGSIPMGRPTQPQKQGMSTGTKIALLGGAAALAYMYKRNQDARKRGDTSQPQYYQSKNGRIYYRDQTKRVVYVTPPAGGIQVPMQEAQQYQRYQGYPGQSGGADFGGLAGGGGAGY